jgi:hypothetical protein
LHHRADGVAKPQRACCSTRTTRRTVELLLSARGVDCPPPTRYGDSRCARATRDNHHVHAAGARRHVGFSAGTHSIVLLSDAPLYTRSERQLGCFCVDRVFRQHGRPNRLR